MIAMAVGVIQPCGGIRGSSEFDALAMQGSLTPMAAAGKIVQSPVVVYAPR